MTHYTAADLEASARHIAQGERHMRRQVEIIADLRSAGHSTAMAEEVLEQFKAGLANHHEHRAAIVAALEAAGKPVG